MGNLQLCYFSSSFQLFRVIWVFIEILTVFVLILWVMFCGAGFESLAAGLWGSWVQCLDWFVGSSPGPSHWAGYGLRVSPGRLPPDELGPCLHPVSCLVWEILVLVPAYWVEVALGPAATKLKGGFQNASCQHQCPCGSMSSLSGCHQCLCPRASSSCPLLLQETLQDQQVVLTQSPFIWLLLPCEIVSAFFNSGVFISHNPLSLLKVSPAGLQSQTFWGLALLRQDPGLGSLLWGSGPFPPWGEVLQWSLFSHLWIAQPGLWVLTVLRQFPSCPSCCDSFFISLVAEELF